jgi:hypothetical protein
LTDSNESLWFGPITIGGESFNVDFDTVRGFIIELRITILSPSFR